MNTKIINCGDKIIIRSINAIIHHMDDISVILDEAERNGILSEAEHRQSLVTITKAYYHEIQNVLDSDIVKN